MPGPKTPTAITLTRDERSYLESLASKVTAPYRDVIRAKMILWVADGVAISEVSRRTDFGRAVVRRWALRFKKKRLKGLQDEARSGRPPTFSPSGGHGPGEAGLPATR